MITSPPNDRGENDPEDAPQPHHSRLLLVSVFAGTLAIVLVAAFLIWGGPSPDTPAQAQQNDRAAPVKVSAAELKALPESDTHATISGAPTDPAPSGGTSGAVVHPKKTTAIFAAPGGKPIAKVGPSQLGDTWLPVVGARPGWVQVLLPSKPNGSTGWLQGGDVEGAFTPYVVRVQLAEKKLELWKRDRKAGSWTIGIGKPDTPTPTGRTFILGSITDDKQQYSPVILPLGSHSDTLDTFGGGPGTVAIHTWPTNDVFGGANSHGCIRVPADALERLTKVPLGTLVLVED